ncbi:MAG TPA: hypothetical protein VMC80_02115 [Patescibacteria group bacterium]|nr:hypothetical protein [Patescibacteria group bacterium]
MTIRNYKTKEEALNEMKLCIGLEEDLFDPILSRLDRIRNAGCYILARDDAIRLGVDTSNYPKSIGKVNWGLF